MAAITISRQMGSLGCEVARAVADMLSYRLIWRELINQAARRSGSPDVALATIDELGLLDICPSTKACDAYRQAVAQVMQELAAEGNIVIVGRAGQVILRDQPNILHVRIVAPTEVRAERVSAKQNISLNCAKAQIQASDSYRITYMRRFYQVHPGNPDLYHLLINTGRVLVDQAAALICQSQHQLLEDNPPSNHYIHGHNH
jgi:cytidylate kinase